MKFHPLDSDYWPPQVRNPMARLALAASMTPILCAAGLTLFIAAVKAFGPYGGQPPFGGPMELFGDLTLELTIFAISAIAPAFLLLWTLRARTRRAFVLAALLGGAIGALVSSIRFGSLPVSHFFIALALSVGMALMFRTLAGLGEKFR